MSDQRRIRMNAQILLVISTLITAALGLATGYVNARYEPKIIKQHPRVAFLFFSMLLIAQIIALLLVDKQISIPRYESFINSLEEGKKFNDFMLSNGGKIVYFDIYLMDVQGLFTQSPPTFKIEDRCFTDVPRICAGAEYVIESAQNNTFAFYNFGSPEVKGNFEIINIAGPHMEDMIVYLRLVAAENILSH